MIVTLPIPPSVNNLFFNRAKGRAKTAKYDKWIHDAGIMLNAARARPVASPVRVSISVGECNSQRDLDNLSKPILDLLVRHKIIPNDNIKNVHLVVVYKDFKNVEKGMVIISMQKSKGPAISDESLLSVAFGEMNTAENATNPSYLLGRRSSTRNTPPET